MVSGLILPDYYDPNMVGRLYTPATDAAFKAGRQNVTRTSAAGDKVRTILVLVDVQVDFVHEDGNLSVPGAVADTRRTVDWMYQNTVNGKLSAIAASLDSHVPLQIFFPPWWVDAEGNNPPPYTAITMQTLLEGKYYPAIGGAMQEWSYNYVEQLEHVAKKPLMIWPFHTMLGTPGHAIVPAVYEAMAFHSGARGAQPIMLSKGSIPETEHYSILEPEIKVPGNPHGSLNTDFLDMVASYDRIYIAGQAKSHCILETIESMVRYFDKQREVIRKMFFLMDAMSSVQHPTIDFEAIANQRFEEFRRKGANLVTTLDAVA